MDGNRDESQARVNRAIGGRVAWYMKYAGDARHTQAELAQLLGIEQSAVSKKLTGRRPFFPHELYKIAEWLDRSLGDFLPLTESLATPPDTGPGRPTSGRDRTGDTGQYVSSNPRVRFSRNVTSGRASVAQAA